MVAGTAKLRIFGPDDADRPIQQVQPVLSSLEETHTLSSYIGDEIP